MMGVLESNIDQLPIIAFLAMLVHLASKKLKKFHVEGARQQFWLARALFSPRIQNVKKHKTTAMPSIVHNTSNTTKTPPTTS